jgi:DNA polymerase elongation subunit (family B)
MTNDKDLVFNVIDVFAEDVENGGKRNYLVKLFGRSADGRSVSLTATGYTPHFYVKLNHPVAQNQMGLVGKGLSGALYGLHAVRLVNRKDFWGFTNDATFQFLQLLFTTTAQMRAAATAFGKKIDIGTGLGPRLYKLYESNIDPFLRMFHKCDIAPCGWVRVPAGTYGPNTYLLKSTSNVDVVTTWSNLKPVDRPTIAPIRIASFDIECVSLDGQFPLAIRDYRKLIDNFIDAHGNLLKGGDACTSLGVGGAFVAFFMDMFDRRKLLLKEDVPRAVLLDRLHAISDIMVGILRGTMAPARNGGACDTVTRTWDADRDAIMDDAARRFNKSFPSLEGDPIIQIGTTVHVYGEREASSKFVFVLGTCEDIPGTVVKTYDTERGLLLGWSAFLKEIDPDVLLGYNILGFDFQYMRDRAEELGCLQEFSRLGRIQGRICPFRTKNLSSSALGDNFLKYFDIEGRVVVDIMKVVQRDHKLDSYKLDNVAHHFIGQKKNDVSPADIFRLHGLGPADRRVVAEYCVQDCALLNKLTVKLEIIANNVGMANVCCVPLNYIFMRGQGIKIFSLVAKRCKEDDYLIPVVKCAYGSVGGDEEGYEGAIVLTPTPGIYIDKPIAVLDYASLYPSSMISENISHNTIVIDPTYDNLPDVEYVDVSYDEYTGTGADKKKSGTKTCRYAQNRAGVLPSILQNLLGARKATRKRIEWERLRLGDGTTLVGLVADGPDGRLVVKCEDGVERACAAADVVSREDAHDPFQKAVLDGLQLAYKVTANSLYGQVGARTSQIYLKDLAASTTATGRNMIIKAKDFIEKKFDGKVIYGDTDSIFIQMNRDLTGMDHGAMVKAAMEYGLSAQKSFRPYLKAPHDAEFEKVISPFLIISKKRYLGNVYDDINKPTEYKMKCMGVVLKRRDNAPFVKTIFGGVVDIILNRHDIGAAVRFLRENLQDLVGGKFPLEELIITKSLRSGYRDPTRIAHKVLADRMAVRDPGNKPQSSDRIPYVYVITDETGKDKVLQGERIETPDFIRANSLAPDYKFYLEHQLMAPVCQIFGLVVEQLPGYSKTPDYWGRMRVKLAETLDGDKLDDKLMALREIEAQRLLFEPTLVQLGDKAKRRRAILDDDRTVKQPVKKVVKPKATPAPNAEGGDGPSTSSVAPTTRAVNKAAILLEEGEEPPILATPAKRTTRRKIMANGSTLEQPLEEGPAVAPARKPRSKKKGVAAGDTIVLADGSTVNHPPVIDNAVQEEGPAVAPARKPRSKKKGVAAGDTIVLADGQVIAVAIPNAGAEAVSSEHDIGPTTSVGSHSKGAENAGLQTAGASSSGSTKKKAVAHASESIETARKRASK